MRAVNVRDAGEIERAFAAFAQVPNSGVIVSGGPEQTARRELIIALAAEHRLPAIYNARFLPPRPVSSPTAPISSTSPGAPLRMSIAF